MSKCIEAEELKKALDKYNVCGYMQEIPFLEVLKTIENLPAVDIVRCKDCKYLDYVDEHEKWCMGRGNPATMVKDDGYCEIGKRKEDFCSNGKARD